MDHRTIAQGPWAGTNAADSPVVGSPLDPPGVTGVDAPGVDGWGVSDCADDGCDPGEFPPWLVDARAAGVLLPGAAGVCCCDGLRDDERKSNGLRWSVALGVVWSCACDTPPKNLSIVGRGSLSWRERAGECSAAATAGGGECGCLVRVDAGV